MLGGADVYLKPSVILLLTPFHTYTGRAEGVRAGSSTGATSTGDGQPYKNALGILV